MEDFKYIRPETVVKNLIHDKQAIGLVIQLVECYVPESNG